MGDKDNNEDNSGEDNLENVREGIQDNVDDVNWDNGKEGNWDSFGQGNWVNGEEGNASDEVSEHNDNDFIVVEYNVLDDVYVDMKDFKKNVDHDVEWGGGHRNTTVEQELQQGYDEMLDNDILLSGSYSNEGPNHQRKKIIKSIRNTYTCLSTKRIRW